MSERKSPEQVNREAIRNLKARVELLAAIALLADEADAIKLATDLTNDVNGPYRADWEDEAVAWWLSMAQEAQGLLEARGAKIPLRNLSNDYVLKQCATSRGFSVMLVARLGTDGKTWRYAAARADADGGYVRRDWQKSLSKAREDANVLYRQDRS